MKVIWVNLRCKVSELRLGNHPIIGKQVRNTNGQLEGTVAGLEGNRVKRKRTTRK